MTIYDLQGSLKGRIVDILLNELEYHIEVWQAEEIAELIIAEIIGE